MIADMDEENRDDQKGKGNNMNEQKLLLASEVAEILGGKWTRTMVHTYLKRKRFPDPVSYVSNQPLWTMDQINQFKKDWGNR